MSKGIHLPNCPKIHPKNLVMGHTQGLIDKWVYVPLHIYGTTRSNGSIPESQMTYMNLEDSYVICKPIHFDQPDKQKGKKTFPVCLTMQGN